MSASVNKVTLIGNLGRDPESKGKGDTPIALLTIATTRSWKDRSTGERREETEWHRVVAYQGLAKIVLDYAKKGRQVYVEGFLRTRKWADAQGQEHYVTEIVGEEVKLLGSNPSPAPSAKPADAAPAIAPAKEPSARIDAPAPIAAAATPAPEPTAPAPAPAAPKQAGLLDEDNDIPF